MTYPYHPSLTQTEGDTLRWITHDYWIDNQHLLHGPNVATALVQPEASSQPFIKPYSAILHSNAGVSKTPWWNLIAYWRRSDIVGEAHLQIDGVDLPATVVQAIPFDRRADCNYKANRFAHFTDWVGAISFETQDRGGSSLATTPWSLGDHTVPTETWGQVDSMISALTCLCVCYRVWCTVPAYWNDSGIGHHCLYPEWSSYIGKTCPGAARIRQMDYIRTQVANNLAVYGRATGWKCVKQ